MKKLTYFLSLLTCLILSRPGTGFAETAHQSHSNLDWPGVYQGFVPCADCKGIKTSLALNSNQSYILITQFVGKSEREFVEKGKFTWDDDKDTLVLTPKNGGATRYYLASENTMTQLDEHGNPITGSQAKNYVLRRNEIKQAPSAHPMH